MKGFKVLVFSALIFSLMYGSTILAASKSVGDGSFNVVSAKKALVEKYEHNKISMTDEEKAERRKNIQRIVAEMVASGKSVEQIKNEMNKFDVYVLENPEYDPGFTTYSSDSGDITLNDPMITYDSRSGEWTVTGGGSWENDDEWFEESPFLKDVGEIRNLGGHDSVGVTFFDTNDEYNTSVVDSLGYWTDHDGWSEESENPDYGTGRYGIAFSYQDKVKLLSKNIFTGNYKVEDTRYLGRGFACSITFDSNFVDYDGKARTFYVHTYNNTDISSISLSGGTNNFGVGIQYSNGSSKWKAFSGSDIDF